MFRKMMIATALLCGGLLGSLGMTSQAEARPGLVYRAVVPRPYYARPYAYARPYYARPYYGGYYRGPYGGYGYGYRGGVQVGPGIGVYW